MIGLLVQFGFDQEQADAIFACDAWDYNVRSRRAFEKAGFRIVTLREAAPGSKGRSIYDLAIFRDGADGGWLEPSARSEKCASAPGLLGLGLRSE